MISRRTLAAIAYLAGSALSGAAPSEVEKAFKDFVAKFDRNYATPEEEANRFRIFESNFNFINAENSKGRSYFLVVNDFTDQSMEEFNSTNFGLSPPSTGKLWGSSPRLGVDEYSGKDVPKEWDWSTKGAVTPVKNQGTCGSCWSFSTTGALEGAWQIKTGKLVPLSEQQLIDCDKVDSGCKGGAMDDAFDFLKDHDSCTEESYPYETKQNDKCSANCTVEIPKGSIKGHWDVPTETKALMEAVAQQPVSVGIEADQTSFQSYGGGVLSKACGSKLDHGVLIVGYGTENGVDYWKVKNSWGPNWGEKGYVRIERGVPGDGECGIKKMASYPEVISSGPVPSPTPGPAPTPGPTPSPGPTPPTPGCKDAEHYCQDSVVFQPATDCKILASTCKKTCGCCTDTPKDWCDGLVTKDLTVVV